MKKFYVVVLLLLFAVHPSQSQEGNTILIEKFRQEKKVTQLLTDKHGTPTYIEGSLTPSGAKSGDNAEEKTFQFFEENRGLFKLNEPRNELKIIRVKKDETGMTHVRLIQLYKGVEIYGAESITHFRNSGELSVVNGDFQTGIDISADPKIAASEAEGIALSNISYTGIKPEIKSTRLVIYKFNDVAYLTWISQISVENPAGSWEYFINAENGSLVFMANRR